MILREVEPREGPKMLDGYQEMQRRVEVLGENAPKGHEKSIALLDSLVKDD